MTTSLNKSDICNLALDYLLEKNQDLVTNIETPNTETERVCGRWYDVTRRSVLRKHPWLFARKRIVLTSVVGVPTFGFSHAYNLPNDFIRLVSIEDPNSFDPFLRTDYTIENNQILTNPVRDQASSPTAENLNVVYIYDFQNVGQMDSLFIEVLAMEMALNMAYRITSSNTNIQRIETLLKDKLQSARSINGQERPPFRIERSRSQSVRRQLGNNQVTSILNG